MECRQLEPYHFTLVRTDVVRLRGAIGSWYDVTSPDLWALVDIVATYP